MLYICGVKVDQITKTNRIKHNHIPVYTLQHDNRELSRDSSLFFSVVGQSLLLGIDAHQFHLEGEGGVGCDAGLGRTLGTVGEIAGDVEDVSAAGGH